MRKEIEIIQEGALGTRPSWDEFFMGMAIWYSSRYSCLYVRAGSIAVQGNEPVGFGYNGAPTQLDNCLVTGCRKEKKGLVYEESLNTGECIGIHGEMNTFGHLRKIGLRDVGLYTTIFPCHDCGKNSLPYKVERVVFKSLYSEKETNSTVELLTEAKVKIQQLDLSLKRCFDIMVGRAARSLDIWTPEERKWAENLFTNNPK